MEVVLSQVKSRTGGGPWRSATGGTRQTGSGEEEAYRARLSIRVSLPGSISLTVVLRKAVRRHVSHLYKPFAHLGSFMRRGTVRYSRVSIGPVKPRPEPALDEDVDLWRRVETPTSFP